MPRSSSPACPTTVPAHPPSAQPQPGAAKRRGNPNLARIPRCGARTRAGCACRAPAIHGKLRCRMHGGRSTGPRTAEGMARLRAAHTIHGEYGAEARAFNRHHFTFLRRSSVRLFAARHYERLPPELAARIRPMAPELWVPPRPTGGITRAEDRALLQAETATLAPWKQAMALARQARREDRAARAVLSGASAAAQAGPLAPERAAGAGVAASGASFSGSASALPRAHAPIPPSPARPAAQPAPASACAAPSAKLHGSKRARHGVRGARPAGNPAGLPKAHAPIPPAPARPAPQPAPASARVEPVATPHAPVRASHGTSNTVARADPAALPEAHAPIRAAKPDRLGRTISVGRGARRWQRQQKLMHQNQREGSRP